MSLPRFTGSQEKNTALVGQMVGWYDSDNNAAQHSWALGLAELGKNELFLRCHGYTIQLIFT